MAATDIHGSQAQEPMWALPPQPTTSGARATSGIVWEMITSGSRPRSAQRDQHITSASPSPTATPRTNPAMATRNVYQAASATTTPTARVSARFTGSVKRDRMSGTDGIDRSSVRGRMRVPKSSPPDSGPSTL